MEKKFKKYFFTLGVCTMSLVPIAGTIVSCGTTYNSDVPRTLIPSTSKNYWENKEKNSNPVTIVWNANKTHTIDDMFDQINSQMHFYMPDGIANMTPYSLATYLLNFYNNNGNGRITLEFDYKPKGQNTLKKEVQKNDFENNMKDIIKSFDSGSNPIRKNSPVIKEKFRKSVIEILAKLGKTKATISDLLQLFGNYGSDVFGESTIALGLDFIRGDSTQKIDGIASLINSLPAEAINKFSFEGVNLFGTIGKEFSNSKLGAIWAKDNGINPNDFKQLDHLLIKKIMGN